MDEYKDWIPVVGMNFDTLEVAYEFWKTYANKMGFGVRKEYSNKNKKTGVITNQLFVCCKEGVKRGKQIDVEIRHRSDTRTNCMSRLNVCLDKESGKYVVKEFIKEHNHELHLASTTHMIRSHREVTTSHALAIELATDSGLTPKMTQELLSREAGGGNKLGFVIEDQKSYLRSRRKRDMAHGDIGSILTYFEKRIMDDNNFHYALQLDSEEQVTNIFWVDAKMVADYDVFGDVVTFDTTFGTNEEKRPLGVFTGFNHHRQIVIFGAALLYDETCDSFEWLFTTFVNTHKGTKPRSIFTDEDAAMSSALEKVWKEVPHGLCTWHIRQNALKHLGCYMKNKSPILSDFNKCMYEYEDVEEFENKWKIMLECHNLMENNWLKRIYGKRKKWAKAYMKNIFTLGIRSTQSCESVNSDLKDHLKCTLGVGDFFKHFDRVVEQKRQKELEAEFKLRENSPSLAFSKSPILKQASQRYTLKFFNLFKEEYECVDSFIVNENSEDPKIFVVARHDASEKVYQVFCDIQSENVLCSCMTFEGEGILCCHVLRVFSRLNITSIPEKYILHRQTKVAKSRVLLEEEKPKEEEEAKFWIRRVQSQLLRLTYQASMNKDTRDLMEAMINECGKKFQGFSMGDEVENVDVIENKVIDQMKNIRGLKQKQGVNGKRRMKPQHEIRQQKNRKKTKSKKGDCSSSHVTKLMENRPSSTEILLHPSSSLENLNQDSTTFDLNVEPNQNIEDVSLSTPFHILLNRMS